MLVWLVFDTQMDRNHGQQVKEVEHEHAKLMQSSNEVKVHAIGQNELGDVTNLLESSEAKQKLRYDLLSSVPLAVLSSQNVQGPATCSVDEGERQVEARLRNALRLVMVENVAHLALCKV